MKWEDIPPKHLVSLENCVVQSTHFDQRFTPYFEVSHEGEVLKIRTSSEEVQTWIEKHEHDHLTLTIFPYKWAACGRSGVINYFKDARVVRS
jgi:hypothetical protein